MDVLTTIKIIHLAILTQTTIGSGDDFCTERLYDSTYLVNGRPAEPINDDQAGKWRWMRQYLEVIDQGSLPAGPQCPPEGWKPQTASLDISEKLKRTTTVTTTDTIKAGIVPLFGLLIGTNAEFVKQNKTEFTSESERKRSQPYQSGQKARLYRIFTVRRDREVVRQDLVSHPRGRRIEEHVGFGSATGSLNAEFNFCTGLYTEPEATGPTTPPCNTQVKPPAEA